MLFRVTVETFGDRFDAIADGTENLFRLMGMIENAQHVQRAVVVPFGSDAMIPEHFGCGGFRKWVATLRDDPTRCAVCDAPFEPARVEARACCPQCVQRGDEIRARSGR